MSITQEEYDRHAKGLRGSALAVFLIFVTQEDIDSGDKSDELNPVARAVARRLSLSHCDVRSYMQRTFISGHSYINDPHIYMFMSHWLTGRPVKPVEFDLQVSRNQCKHLVPDGVFNQDMPSDSFEPGYIIWKKDIC